MGSAPNPEYTYIAADGDAGCFHGHLSDSIGNVYEQTWLTSARIKVSIKKSIIPTEMR